MCSAQGDVKPNPGSDAAVSQGCLCPVLDNAHGRGAWGTSGPGALFWTTKRCPLHSGGPDLSISGAIL